VDPAPITKAGFGASGSSVEFIFWFYFFGLFLLGAVNSFERLVATISP
jgi:hypothetical protein